ncbi:MAG: MFS transporter, partial [Bacteroidota bacterium]
RRYRPVGVMLVGSILLAVAYLIVPPALALGYAALVFMMLVLTVGEMLYMPFTSTYVSLHAPPARRGEYLGVLSASYSAAFVLGPLIGFGLADRFDYATAFFTCCGIAGLGWLVLTRVEAIRGAKPSARPLAS